MRGYLKGLGACGLLVTGIGAAGCGSSGNNPATGSGGSSSEKPAVESSSSSSEIHDSSADITITFPLEGSLTGGGESAFRVKGKVHSAAGEPVSINSGEVTVNGVVANIKSGTLNEWYVDIPLQPGDNVVSATYQVGDSTATENITLNNGLIRNFSTERTFNGQVYGVAAETFSLYVLDKNATPSAELIPTALSEALEQCEETREFTFISPSDMSFVCINGEGGTEATYTTYIYNADSQVITPTDIEWPAFLQKRARLIGSDIAVSVDYRLWIHKLSSGETIGINAKQLMNDGVAPEFSSFERFVEVVEDQVFLKVNPYSLIAVDVDALLSYSGEEGKSIPYTSVYDVGNIESGVVMGDSVCNIDTSTINKVHPLVCYGIASSMETVIASDSVGSGPIWQAGFNRLNGPTLTQFNDSTLRVTGAYGDGVFDVDINTLVRTEIAPAGVLQGDLHATKLPGQYLSYSAQTGITTAVNVDDFSIRRIAAPGPNTDFDLIERPNTRGALSISGDKVLHLNNFGYVATPDQSHPLITTMQLADGSNATGLSTADMAQMLGHDLGAYRYRIADIKQHPSSGYIIALSALPVISSESPPADGYYQLSESFNELTAISLIVYEDPSFADTLEAEVQPFSNIDPDSGSFVVSSPFDGSVNLLSPPYSTPSQLLAPGNPYVFVNPPFVDWSRNQMLAIGFPESEYFVGDADFNLPTLFSLNLLSGELVEMPGRGISRGFEQLTLIPELGLYRTYQNPYYVFRNASYTFVTPAMTDPSLILIEPDSGDSVVKPLTIH